MKITGGNWKVGNHASCVVTDDKSAVDFEKRDTPESLKYYGGALIAESCRKADAKLIAAAPELLEALIEAKRMYEAIEPVGGWQGVYEQIIYAIKKATG